MYIVVFFCDYTMFYHFFFQTWRTSTTHVTIEVLNINNNADSRHELCYARVVAISGIKKSKLMQE